MKKYIMTLILTITVGLGTRCTDLSEVWYSEVTPETFFTSKQNIYAVLVRSFTHWRWFQTADRFQLQEYTTDEMCITQKGIHFESGGIYRRLHYHTWTPDESQIYETWRGVGMGIALALESKEDLAAVDYERLGLTQEEKDSHQMQLQTLIAYFYLKGLDFFGGMPIYTNSEQKNIPRATDRETFEHIEQILKEAIPKLPLKKFGDPEDGLIRRATAATLLAQLYFNAQAYIGEEMFDKCAEICQDILDGDYGDYELDPEWWGPFTFDNDTSSKEIIWSAVSQNTKYEYSWYYPRFYHYNSYVYFDIDKGTNGNNGAHLQPSLKPNGQPYTDADFRLGRPFSRFHEKDLRKKPYVYLGSGKYEGMFLMGTQTNPKTGKSTTGAYEYKGETIVFVDQVAQFKKLGTPGYETADLLPSDIRSGEENTGIRLVKLPQPNTADKDIRWNSDYPVIRLAEIYYMLAECKFRAGDKSGAADLFNEVRKRNFPNRMDPDPVTAENIDKYRILNEWMIEFLGEQRRRTDLIRWNAFTTENWWDHKATQNDYLNRFPVPTKVMSTSNEIKQNPGY